MVSTEIAGKTALEESGAAAAMVAVEIAGPAPVGAGERLEAVPGPDAARPAARVFPLLAAAFTCLGLAALLVSGKLVEIAERQPLGETRDWWLGLAGDVDRASNFLSLNRPYDLILDVRGVGSDAGRQVDSIEAVAAAAGIDPDAPAVEGAATEGAAAESSGGEGAIGEDGGEGTGAAGSVQDPAGAPADPNPPVVGDPSPPDRPVTDSPDADPADSDLPGGNLTDGSSTDGSSTGDDPDGADPPVTTDDPAGGDSPVTDPSGTGTTGGDSPATDSPDGDLADAELSTAGPAGAELAGSGSIIIGLPGSGPPVTDPSDADPSGGETTDPVPAPAGRTVTPEAPLRTYVAGDSQATFLGHALHGGRVRGLLDVTVGDRNSTSLARPDYFNWPAEVQKVAATDDPELIVFFLGANDWQNMVSGEGALLRRGTEEWNQEWGWRLFITLEVLKSEHRHVVWVGQPPMRSDPFREGAPVMNEIARRIIAGREDVTMIDIWEMFGGDGEYRERVVGPDGEEFRARQNDGVHLRREASEWVADLVVEAVARRWDLQPG